MRAVLFPVLLLVACGSPAGRAGDARTLLSRGDYAGAEQAADEALARSPDDRSLWHLKLDAVARSGEHARAVELYRQWHQRRRHYDEEAIRILARGVLRAASTDPAASVRGRAVAAMRRARGGGFEDALEARLGDADPVVRAAA
ncbi:MAG TPA: tetratricopeptide repeat protein, partial [Kofleriaceae bacterium]|nr:tetratricopeptide repeat protein [Kofleriaceae bacterium]